MRAFFAILLLLNLGLLAYQLWTTGEAPLPLRPREVNAEKILVLDPARLPAPQRNEAARPADVATAPATGAPAPVPGAQCLEWGTFETSAVARAEELLAQRLPEIRYTRDSPEGVARFWVFIPSAGSAEETQARLQRLARKGAGDVVVVRDDPELRGAVSLGIYSSAAAAQRRMAELDRLRIRGARVLERRTGGSVAQLLLRDVDPALRPNLEQLAREITNTELRVVQCPAALTQRQPDS
jgi:hypothetical protein